MENLTATTICPVCQENVFSINQISDVERQWSVRLLCETTACNFNTLFTITMSSRVFEIFKMEFKPVMDTRSDRSHAVSAGYHDVSLFLIYVIDLLGRASVDYLREHIQIAETDLAAYLTKLSEDDLVAFDGRYVLISEQGRTLIQTFLSQKNSASAAANENDFDALQQTLRRMLLDGAIEEFNAERSQINNVMIDLSSIDLSGKRISHANFRKTSLTRSSFESSVLEHCNFTDAAIDYSNLKNASLVGCQIQRSDLKSSDLSSAVFENSILAESNLSQTNAFRATFRDCNLRAADFSKANLRAAQAQRSDFTRSHLTRADMTGANFTEAIFNEADFDDCDLNKTQVDVGTQFLSVQNILSARNISKQLWQKIHHQNKRLPDFAEYEIWHKPEKASH